MSKHISEGFAEKPGGTAGTIIINRLADFRRDQFQEELLMDEIHPIVADNGVMLIRRAVGI